MTHGSTLPVGRGLWFVLIAATAWGTGGAAASVLYDTSGLGPLAVSFWRFVGGMLLLAAARAAIRRCDTAHPVRRRRPWVRLGITGCGMAVYQTAYYVAIDLAGLAVATVVTLGAGPVLIAAGARLTGLERLGGAGTGAVLAAVTGLVLLVGDDTGTADGTARLTGIAVALLSAAGYALVTLLTRHAGTFGGPDPYDTAVVGFAVGAVALAPLAAPEGLLPTAGSWPQTLGWLCYVALVPTALAYGLFFAGLAVVRATTASLVALVEPVTATAVAVALLGERLGVRAAAGAAVLLATVGVLVVAERRSRTVDSPVG